MMGTLTWKKPASSLPDAEERVLMWLRQPDGTEEWDAGQWDGQEWLLDWCGAPPDGHVLAWARPQGPQA